MADKRNASKRIMKDLKEIEKDPVEGCSIAPYEGNLFKLHVNITVQDGPYKGNIMHIVLDIPPTYPHSSPAGSMAPEFPFGQEDHEHIHGTGICNDYLSNYESFFKMIDGGNIQAGSGWTSACTLKSLLMILQQFFVDPDNVKPNENHINRVRTMIDKYECPCGHTTKNPDPPIHSSSESKQEVIESSSVSSLSDLQIKRAREVLICFASKENIIDNKDIKLGYPIDLNRDRYGRIHPNLVPELISYEQYILEVQKNGGFVSCSRNGTKFRTASGKTYTNWLPIYINEEHFNNVRQHTENCISVISNGIRGVEKNDFQPEMVIRVLPCLMNKMVVAIMNGNLHESESAIFAYCHYLRLFMRFLHEYKDLQDKIEHKMAKFSTDVKSRDKQNIGDIGEFIICLALSKQFTYDKMKDVLLGEYFARQIYWINKENDRFLKNISNNMAGIFNTVKISNHLLVFNLMMTKTFVFTGVEEKLDQNYGLPPQPIIDGFQQLIKKIKAIQDYPTLMKAISYSDKITSQNDMINFYKEAIIMSQSQGYTR